jgi:hypothetical protein
MCDAVKVWSVARKERDRVPSAQTAVAKRRHFCRRNQPCRRQPAFTHFMASPLQNAGAGGTHDRSILYLEDAAGRPGHIGARVFVVADLSFNGDGADRDWDDACAGREHAIHRDGDDV